MTINDKQDQLIEQFEPFDDWMDRYSLIIDMGNALEALSPDEHTADNLIEGCQSRLWLKATRNPDGTIHFRADSDAIIVKGIVAMLIEVLDGETPQAVLDADLYFIDRIGLNEHLSPTRANGLLAMLKQMRAYALAFSTLQ